MQASSPGPPMAPHRAPTLEDDVLVAASRGQVELLRELLAAGATLQTDKDGRTALHYAAQEGHADTCIFLLSRGCGLDSQDVMGYSPLLRAASQGARDAVQILLEAGCNVNLQDEHGNAAIHETCWNGFSKTAEMLVHHNCDVFLTNKAGFTALHLAAQNGHNESSRVLLYAGCNPDIKNNYGDTALHTAARYGHAGVARILISARCKLSEQNKNGDSALHIAAALKRRKIAKILVESGTDVELVNKQSETAMDVAKRKEHPEIVLIISSYAKPRPQPQHHHAHHPGVTFKDEIEMVDGPVVCPDNQPPIKKEQPSSTRPEKEKKAGFFFSFKRKKKDKSKERSSSAPNTPTTSGQKFGPGASTPGKDAPPSNRAQLEQGDRERKNTAVHGFFSRYVPRDGVQFYRDLAGNIKQGPIGYAPVCQCGPSLRHLESNLTSTKDSLNQRIDVSHHILSRRIDDIDIRTRPLHHPDMGRRGGYLTDSALHQRPYREHMHAHSYHHHQRMHRTLHDADDDDDEDDVSGDEDYRYENSLDMGIGSRDSRDLMQNGDMPEDLEYWLTDKLASYGHCLNHHHDDSALPPRNLFTDFPHSALGMGRLVRSRSDETLSASDYSGKFRKRDFYASRQAAMQQIRGWELPRSSNKAGKKTKTPTSKHNLTDNSGSHRTATATITTTGNNNNHPGGRKVVTQVQIHSQTGAEIHKPQQQHIARSENAGGPGVLSPSTNSTTSPGTLASSSIEVRDKSSIDQVSTSVSHSWHGHLHQQHKPEIPNNRPTGPGSDNSRGTQFLSNFEDGRLQEASLRNHNMPKPPYPQPPRYEHQHYQAQPKDLGLSISQNQSGLRDHMYSYKEKEAGPTQQQNSHNRGPVSLSQNINKQEDFSSVVHASHQRSENGSSFTPQQPGFVSPQGNSNGINAGPPIGLTRYQDKYGVRYNRNRALSSDALNDDNYEDTERHKVVSQHSDFQRSRSMDNAIEDRKTISHYSTNTEVRPTPNAALTPRRLSSPRGSGRESQSLSPAPRATTRYRLPETSSSETASSSSSQWHQNHQINSLHPSVPNPSLSTNIQRPRTTENPRQAHSPSTVPSSHNFSGSNMHSDQIHGNRRPYLSSAPLDNKDTDYVFSGQSDCQLPSQSHETSKAPQSSSIERSSVRECLQHNNSLLSPRLPSMTESSGGKEDSTCSSNQDSGYGQGRSRAERPFGGGTDTSVGTPSSSFSIERSNTPSTAGSPYASQRGNAAAAQMFNSSLHSRMSQSGYLSGRGRTYSPFSSGPDGSFRSSSSESHRQGDVFQKSGSVHSGYNHGHQNSERPFSSPSNDSVLSGESMGRNNVNQKTSTFSYATQNSKDYSCSAGQINNSSNTKHYSSSAPFLQSHPHRVSGAFTNAPYNAEMPPKHPNNMLGNSNPSKNTPSRPGPPPPPKPNVRKNFNNPQNGPVQNPSTPCGNGPEVPHSNSYSLSNTQQPFSTNSTPNNKTRQESHAPVKYGYMTQSKVQAHVQGWYQRVVLEAADRLRQTENYNSNPPTSKNNTPHGYSIDSTSSDSPRQASASASSTGNSTGRSSNKPVFHDYSSSSPSPSPQGPGGRNNFTGKPAHPLPPSAQPPYYHYQQLQQQSSYNQRLNNSSSSYNNSFNDSKNYNNSSPHSQFSSQSMGNYTSPNRPFSPQSHSEVSNFQYQSGRTVNSNPGDTTGCLPKEDTYSKIQHSHYSSPYNNNSSDYAPYNNNSAHGLGRVNGGHIRFDPIHGSDV
ncbi:ankyrin repeat domain-containing protein 6 [Elysia marginata]|uniref:Ankyrin repeat domain-containing protein 6 n=1 Tax=Elysia marginata TaxID=1093978 RepID=A0AAV4EF35_9GAST|nr:ankyrin repeat domain-containing protein 6 [Elysia marginata]